MKKRRFRCPVCGVETKSFSTCSSHYVLKHDEKPSIAAEAISVENQNTMDVKVHNMANEKVQDIQEVHNESRGSADSSGQPGREVCDSGGFNEILDRLLTRTRKPLAEFEDAAPDDKSARIIELAAEVARLSDHNHELDLVSEWARGLTRGAYLELGVKLGYVEEVPVEDSADFH